MRGRGGEGVGCWWWRLPCRGSRGGNGVDV